MDFIIYGIVIILVVIVLFIVKNNSNLKKENQEKEEEIRKISELKRDELKTIFAKDYTELELQKKNLENEINLENQKLLTVEKLQEKTNSEIYKLRENYQKLKSEERNNIDKEISEYKKLQIKLIVNEIDKEREDINNSFRKEKEQIEKEKAQIRAEIDEERQRRAAINEEILRARQVEDNTDFYRICLPENEKGDIELLKTVAPRLQRPEAIYKIIWSNYYQKPLAELRKRLLPKGDKSGIYKITRLKTGEIYIGQTTSIDKRWQEHTKSSLGVGTLASSYLHRAMSMDGPENFTFEIIEECDKDKLKEKESYYIDFYDSKNYGLNSINGAKN